MSLSVTALSDGRGLALAGQVDHADARACRDAGLALLGKLPGSGPWLCDLSGLASGSSVTAAVLMSWQREAGRRGGQLLLQSAPERLLAILAASNLLPVFLSAT